MKHRAVVVPPVSGEPKPCTCASLQNCNCELPSGIKEPSTETAPERLLLEALITIRDGVTAISYKDQVDKLRSIASDATANHAQPLIPPKPESDVGSGKPKEDQDSKRLDWLEVKFSGANQASIISKMTDGRPKYKCSSGFHCGDTIREAIDAAMQNSPSQEPQ